MSTTFKVRDNVCFNYRNKNYFGVFLNESKDFYTIIFDKPNPNWSLNNDKSIHLHKRIHTITHAGPHITQEERVKIKCKKLWNQSNWVKQHPNLSY